LESGTRLTRSSEQQMNEPLQEPGRKQLPHLPLLECPNQSIVQFVSCNVAGRRSLLANAEIHQLLIEAWRKADYWLVGRYVIMPDHLHLFCAPVKIPAAPLKRWMEFWRADVTRHWPHPEEKPIWQKDFFDRQLRSGESYHQKWLYVFENPVRAGLVTRWQDWPCQGELNILQWHEPT
jgi:REP element-mobilizing transposase RayT